jgi:hypothetical protein
MPMTMTERLDHARAALKAYFAEKGDPARVTDADYEDTDVSDLIADLLHLRKVLGLRDIDRTLATATMHFEAEEADEETICGLCGEPGADKTPHPTYWPGEHRPDRDMVHAECEQEACRVAHAALSDSQREAFLRDISKYG